MGNLFMKIVAGNNCIVTVSVVVNRKSPIIVNIPRDEKVQIYSLKSSTKYVLELLLFGANSTGVYIGNNRDFQSGNN